MESFCIIGLGKFGQSLALSLAEEGKQVMVIDTDDDRVSEIADFVTNAVIGDPTNESVMRASGVKDYDCAVVCFTGNINESILLTIMLKEIGVKKVIVRAVNDGHMRVLQHLGADMIVFPEKDMGEKLAFKLVKENVTEYTEFSGYTIIEMKVPASWIGKNLIELNVRRRFGVNIIALTDAEGNVDVSPRPDRVFTAGEKVSVIGNDENIARVMKEK